MKPPIVIAGSTEDILLDIQKHLEQCATSLGKLAHNVTPDDHKVIRTIGYISWHIHTMTTIFIHRWSK